MTSSYVWGAVADRKGRKPVIITSCLLLGLFSAAFGFSVNFAMAVLFRLAVGLTNGKQYNVRCIGPTCVCIHYPSLLIQAVLFVHLFKSVVLIKQCSAQHFLRGVHCQDCPQYALASVTAHSRHQPCWFVRSGSRWTSST